MFGWFGRKSAPELDRCGYSPPPWLRGGDSEGGFARGVESPQDPSVHGYRVKIAGASATIERDCNEPQTTFTPSQVASLGSGPIEIEVRQIGALALSRPQSITINS